jgi:hypothetical protein
MDELLQNNIYNLKLSMESLIFSPSTGTFKANINNNINL